MSLTAPYQPTTGDYAVEAAFTLLRPSPSTRTLIGITGRAGPKGGYRGLYCVYECAGFFSDQTSKFLFDVNPPGSDPELAAVPGTLTDGPHVMRIEFKLDTMELFLDGSLVLQTQSSQFFDPGTVGLVSLKCQLRVDTFRVMAI